MLKKKSFKCFNPAIAVWEHFTFATGQPGGLCLCSRAFRRQAATCESEMLPSGIHWFQSSRSSQSAAMDGLGFQSRARDSLIWKPVFGAEKPIPGMFQSRARDSLIWKVNNSLTIQLNGSGFNPERGIHLFERLEPSVQSEIELGFQSLSRDSLIWKL